MVNEADPIVCPKCELDLRAAEKWKIGPVVHCRGGHANVFGSRRVAHHGHQRVYCQGCGKPLGCDTCIKTPADAARVICLDCKLSADGGKTSDHSGPGLVEMFEKAKTERVPF